MAWTELTRAEHVAQDDALSKRFDRCGMGDRATVVARSQPPWAAATGEVAAGLERNPVVAASGCAWSLLPKEFPPVSTVRYYFYRWRDDGLLAEINRALVAAARLAAGRDKQPTGGVIDSQSVPRMVETSENTSLSGFKRRRQADQGNESATSSPIPVAT